jgi:Tfp pilus assembly PilM family ATPase
MSFLSLHDSAPLDVAVEIAAGRVSAASLDLRGGRPVVAAHATESLPDAVLVPSLTAHNIRDRAIVLAALKSVLERVGRPRRIGLVIPDVTAKVSLVKFEQVPGRAQDLDQLVRWQVRKTAPFAIEDAQVSYVPGLRADDGQEFAVSLAKREIVEEYESLCAEAGAHAGVVDLSTFNVINAVLAGANAPTATPSAGSGSARTGSSADWLLVHLATDYASIALLRGGSLIFFRSRAADADGTLADLVHQTAMYYEDRLQGTGFARVLLSGAAVTAAHQTGDVEDMRHSLETRLTTTVETVDPRGAATLTDRITAAPILLDTLTPLIGLLLRDRHTVPA